MNNNVSIVIITFNREVGLEKTLTYLMKKTEYFEEVILVDNGSTDGTVRMVRKKFPVVKLIRLHKNSGVAEARNIGAINAKNNLIFFLDDDGYFDIESIPMLINQYRKNDKLAVIGCEIIEVPFNDIFALKFRDFKLKKDEIYFTYYFWGTAFMLRRDYFLKVGMFPDYFFYSNEENDLSLRLLKQDLDIMHCNFSIMFHYRSSAQRPKYRKTFFYYRNKQYEIWRNLPIYAAIKESIIVAIGGLIRTIFTRNFFPFCNGTVLAFIKLPHIIVFERKPLSRKQYKRYIQLRGEEIKIITRIKKLLLEIKRGDRKIGG